MVNIDGSQRSKLSEELALRNRMANEISQLLLTPAKPISAYIDFTHSLKKKENKKKVLQRHFFYVFDSILGNLF